MKPPPDRASGVRGADYFTVLARYIRVFLDGVEQRGVIEYCVSEGWVQRLVPNPDGTWKRTRAGDDVERERVTGAVTLEWQK